MTFLKFEVYDGDFAGLPNMLDYSIDMYKSKTNQKQIPDNELQEGKW